MRQDLDLDFFLCSFKEDDVGFVDYDEVGKVAILAIGLQVKNRRPTAVAATV